MFERFYRFCWVFGSILDFKDIFIYFVFIQLGLAPANLMKSSFLSWTFSLSSEEKQTTRAEKKQRLNKTGNNDTKPILRRLVSKTT